MKIIDLTSSTCGYLWNGQVISLETCDSGPFKDKLFMVCPDTTVYKIEKILEIVKAETFRSEKDVSVLKKIGISDRIYTYAEVFLSLARAGTFSIGHSPSFSGYTYGRTWNGFASPYFHKEEFLKICEYFSVVYGNGNDLDLAECRCFYNESTDEFYCEDYYNDYIRERIGFPTIIHTADGPLSVYFFEGCWDWLEHKE